MNNYITDFQPIKVTWGKTNIAGSIVTAALNWGALFGMAYVVAKGMQMGLGL